MMPSLPVLLLGLLVVIGAPMLLHLLLGAASPYTAPPQVFLAGPENAGKTALVTLLERGSRPAPTHTSQAAHAVELTALTDSASRASFRNHADLSGTHTKFLLVDTPGHAKLRAAAVARLARADRLRAVVFMLDAAALADADALAPAAAFLHDVLLLLQRRARPVPLLVAANKMDLFTALPAALARAQLEAELTRLRASRAKGLLNSGVGVDDVAEHDSWLGEAGSDKFSFDQMRDAGVDVDVIGGSVMADEPDVDRWWWWMAQRV